MCTTINLLAVYCCGSSALKMPFMFTEMSFLCHTLLFCVLLRCSVHSNSVVFSVKPFYFASFCDVLCLNFDVLCCCTVMVIAVVFCILSCCFAHCCDVFRTVVVFCALL
jgi:hypothetical protein